MKAIGKGKHWRSPHGDQLIVTPVTLDDGTTVEIEGGTVDGVTMEVPDIQPLLKVGQRVKKVTHGTRQRLIPAERPERPWDGKTLHAYSYSGHKWANGVVSYYINNTNPPPPATITPAQVVASATAALNRWIATGANLSIGTVGTTTNNTATYNHHNDLFWREKQSDDVPGRVMLTYWWYNATGLLDMDIIAFKGVGPFYPLTGGCSGSGVYDDGFRTHEFGHFLGLYHSTTAGATMVANTNWCDTTWRTLEADDRAAILAAYGGTAPPPVAPPDVPVLFMPSNGQVGVTIDPPPTGTNGDLIRWAVSARATSYAVYYGTTNPPPYFRTVIPSSTCVCKSVAYPNTLYNKRSIAAGTYYWRVVAQNTSGAVSSPIWSFTVQ